jgi:8-oxo-dGTP pyrophosphatase MutT (NUDIX family)
MRAARRDALLRALAGYRGWVDGDGDETSDSSTLARFLAFVEREDPFGREEPGGHVTASAVVSTPAGDRFLLVFHRKLDRWLQPGGHVEVDDPTVFDAALREAREETGLAAFAAPLGDAILDIDVHPIPAFGAEPAHFHYDVRFLLTAADEGDTAEDTAWFPADAIPPIDTDGSLSRAVRKAAARLAP